jgi:hypothetical protein
MKIVHSSPTVVRKKGECVGTTLINKKGIISNAKVIATSPHHPR